MSNTNRYYPAFFGETTFKLQSLNVKFGSERGNDGTCATCLSLPLLSEIFKMSQGTVAKAARSALQLAQAIQGIVLSPSLSLSLNQPRGCSLSHLVHDFDTATGCHSVVASPIYRYSCPFGIGYPREVVSAKQQISDFQYLFGLFRLPHKTKQDMKMLNP